VQRRHPWAQGCCWAQSGSFRGAEQQAGVRVVQNLGMATSLIPLLCWFLPLVPARFGAWGPGQSPLPSCGCWWSCEATVFLARRRLLLAPTSLPHRGAGSTLTDPDQLRCCQTGSALQPSAPSSRLPTPPSTPSPVP